MSLIKKIFDKNRKVQIAKCKFNNVIEVSLLWGGARRAGWLESLREKLCNTKVIICALIFSFCVVPANATKGVSDAVLNAWGVSENSPYGATNQGQIIYPITKTYSRYPAYKTIYMAQKIVEHGGYFCFTTLCSIDTGGVYSTYYYKQPDGVEKCAWYCENGYSGENCQSGTNNGGCNNIGISESDLENIGLDSANNIEGSIAQNGGFLFYNLGPINGGYSDEFISAAGFIGSGHGISAKPSLFEARANSVDLLTVYNISKTLCADGWTGSDCNTPTAACGGGGTGAYENAADISSCNGDDTKYTTAAGNCADKRSATTTYMAANCWTTMNATDFAECLSLAPLSCGTGMVNVADSACRPQPGAGRGYDISLDNGVVLVGDAIDCPDITNGNGQVRQHLFANYACISCSAGWHLGNGTTSWSVSGGNCAAD
ncbi:MAG: hypothetical protein LBL75_00460 [Rickettsiales bacterium]|jgi:hypothetical protein|nr:hypothetical protein [Rickettsiales bacterium]